MRGTTTPVIADSVIEPRLSEFWNLHQGAEIALHPGRDDVDIRREGVDCAIRARPAVPGSGALHLSSAEVVGAGAPGLVDGRPDAASYPWLWHHGMGSRLAMRRDCGLPVEVLRQVRIGGTGRLPEAAR